ncbi:MAG: T9SS type A sorting domain-containing protein [Bacteroidota bacterium]
MKKTLLLLGLLFTGVITAQNYEWDWAKRGGSLKKAQSEYLYSFNAEQIKDIVVDADNNYYFLAFVTRVGTVYQDLPITTYNGGSDTNPVAPTDVLLISTTSSGELRWTQTIGGHSLDTSYGIKLDGNGGLYLTLYTINLIAPADLPYRNLTHLSPDVELPSHNGNYDELQDGFRTGVFIKYNTEDGGLEWYKMLQGQLNSNFTTCRLSNVEVDNDGNVVFMAGFLKGTHLDGTITITDETFNFHYYLVKYSPDGTLVGAMPLSFTGELLDENYKLRYDKNLDRYYVAGKRFWTDVVPNPLSFNGEPVMSESFLIGFDAEGNQVMRHETVVDNPGPLITYLKLNNIRIDDNSNIYLTGSVYTGEFTTGSIIVSFAGYTFPTAIQGNSAFVIKLNPEGELLWVTHPTPNPDPSVMAVTAATGYDLTINGDEVALATGMWNDTWGEATITRPGDYGEEASLIRFNKETGEAIQIHDISGPLGFVDIGTAVAADNNGDYIFGGTFLHSLFVNGESVGTLTKVQGQADGTDFFIAKLSNPETSGIDDTKQNTIVLFPNPAKDAVYVKDINGELKSYKVYNMLGQQVLDGVFSGTENTIKLSGMPSGSYLVRLTAVDGSITIQKIVKQ